MTDIVIIGAGHNGLVAAFYLAKAGLKPIVLERRAVVGGGAITEEIHPGFHCPALGHELLLHERIVRDMELTRHGLERLDSDVDVCALAAGGPPLVLYDDVARTAEGLRRFSARDADGYAGYRAAVQGITSVLAPLLEAPPPDLDEPGAGDIWNLLKAGRRFRSLGRRDGYRLLRWAPMPVADVVRELFESERLCAAIAAPGISGTMFAPRSAGSMLVLLLREAHLRLAGGKRLRVRGGPGALAHALAAAARSAGADVRTGTSVERIVVRDGRTKGVIVNGDLIAASHVVSAVDPKTTFLSLVDPADLTPEFAAKMRNYRSAGTLAKINLALSALPAFGVDAAALGGRIHIGHELDYLERAFDHVKYGEWSAAPWLEVAIPSVLDPTLAPNGAHVASLYVHCAPHTLRSADWPAARERLLAATLATLEAHAPGVRSQVVAAQVLTPADLEQTTGVAGGHVFHGELALDQLFTMRPLLGYARYGTPIRGLYLCGAGTHPGGFMTGASGRLAARAILAGRRTT